jgi:Arc/MetJ-type ribon-helix-helix transcriptional regulator
VQYGLVRVAKCISIDSKVLEEAKKFLKSHPEFRNMSHLVEYALRKFLEEEAKKGA